MLVMIPWKNYLWDSHFSTFLFILNLHFCKFWNFSRNEVKICDFFVTIPLNESLQRQIFHYISSLVSFYCLYLFCICLYLSVSLCLYLSIYICLYLSIVCIFLSTLHILKWSKDSFLKHLRLPRLIYVAFKFKTYILKFSHELCYEIEFYTFLLYFFALNFEIQL